MSDMPVWSLFAFMAADAEGTMDERRRPAHWQLHRVLDWCLDRGYDNIYFSRDPVEKARFARGAPIEVIRHHMEGASGEQGDDAA